MAGIVRMKYESDGTCIHDMKEGCACLHNYEKTCGTYQCGFYKPIGCRDWVRRERGASIHLIPPEEYK